MTTVPGEALTGVSIVEPDAAGDEPVLVRFSRRLLALRACVLLCPLPGGTGSFATSFPAPSSSESLSESDDELELESEDDDESLDELDATFARFVGGGCVGSRFEFVEAGGPVGADSGPLSEDESKSESELEEEEELEDAGRFEGRVVDFGGEGRVAALVEATAGPG